MSDTSSSDTIVEYHDVPDWQPPKITSTNLEWADILTVDLSLFDTDRVGLVNTVSTALQRDGFFYVVGHGIEPERVCHLKFLPLRESPAHHQPLRNQLKRQFSIGQLTFDGVEREEKEAHRALIAEEGSFMGYKVGHAMPIRKIFIDGQTTVAELLGDQGWCSRSHRTLQLLSEPVNLINLITRK